MLCLHLDSIKIGHFRLLFFFFFFCLDNLGSVSKPVSAYLDCTVLISQYSKLNQNSLYYCFLCSGSASNPGRCLTLLRISGHFRSVRMKPKKNAVQVGISIILRDSYVVKSQRLPSREKKTNNNDISHKRNMFWCNVSDNSDKLALNLILNVNLS